MQQKLNEFAAQLQDLDVYTQRSVIGSWAFVANSQCITQAIRALPNVPDEGEGIEGYTAWEGAIRTLEVEIEKSQEEGGDFRTNLPAFVALQRYVSHMMTETGGDASTVANTHEFLVSKAPTRARFEADFALRVKMGMRPGITRKEFVDAEYTKALDQHAQLIAKGEHAVQLVERMTLKTNGAMERGFDDLPDWVEQTFAQKLVMKLKDRWTNLEMQRTNPRVNAQQRDAAEGDQFLIVEALAQHGELPHAPIAEDDED